MITFARWGIPTLIISTGVLAWGVWLLPPGLPRWIGGGIAALCWLFVLAFFRNPQRTPQGDARTLIAPADGLVADIEDVNEGDFIQGECVRIGIFLSVFDVHVNRSPVDGQVVWAKYTPGKFLDVRHPDASHANEANALGMVADRAVHHDLKLLVRQLSGLIARRIVCTHGPGDGLARGELFGMIRFGSRTELYVPKAVAHEVLVRVGQRVRCGETAMLRILPAEGRP